MAVSFGLKKSANDGSSSALAATSAYAIKQINPSATDGVYWINLPTAGPTQIYCLMDSTYAGGGWMMMMKATTGTTFQYTSSYWTGVNTLNPTDTTRNNADAKFDVMNYFQAKDMLAIFPDITAGTGGSGSIQGKSVLNWYQPNFYAGTRSTPINFFNTVSNYFISDERYFAGMAYGQQYFSTQVDIRFYGFNFSSYNAGNTARWGFGNNENSEGTWNQTTVAATLLASGGAPGSNDVFGGIGVGGTLVASAGDKISCCQDSSGINRTSRVEVYVR